MLLEGEIYSVLVLPFSSLITKLGLSISSTSEILSSTEEGDFTTSLIEIPKAIESAERVVPLSFFMPVRATSRLLGLEM